MKLSDLKFDYPEELVATSRVSPSRIMWVGRDGSPIEITKSQLFDRFLTGDVLVVNDTKVSPRRVVVEDGLDILFLKSLGGRRWEVLFQIRKLSGTKFTLPGGVGAELLTKGRPHTIIVDRELSESYFEEFGEPPLPPYIYRARGDSRAQAEDRAWYQTAWASVVGSVAAPTASFHFGLEDLDELRARGVTVATVTLHVGAGTFLPVTVDDLKDHVMHKEFAFVPAATWKAVLEARSRGGRVWVLGTTATRALESAAAGLLREISVNLPDGSGGFSGETALLIDDGFKFQTVDILLTNFHQPESTLLALLSSYAGRSRVFSAYAWAIAQRFRLFSYGDLSVWEHE